MLFELAGLVQRDPDLLYADRTEQANSRKMLELAERLENEAGFEFVGNRRAIADLVMAPLDGMAAAWLSHRDGQRVRDALATFAGLLASMTRPQGETR